MAEGKSFAGWISGPLLIKAQRRVDRDFGGNASKYVVSLVEDDVAAQSPSFIADEHTSDLSKIAQLSKTLGLDPVNLMRATLSAVVQYADRNGGRITFPITIGSQQDELADSANTWARLSQGDRDALLEHACRGDSWATVLDALKQETTARLMELRLGYLFAMSVPQPANLESLPFVAESPQAAYDSGAKKGQKRKAPPREEGDDRSAPPIPKPA